MHTHVMIRKFQPDFGAKLNVGDFCTLLKVENIGENQRSLSTGLVLKSGIWFRFEEDPDTNYHSGMFRELPKPKTVYVEVEQEVKETMPEICLS